jgi:DNA repair protein RadA
MLVRIAETYDCDALATNQVMASPDVFFGDPTRPVGGNVVAHTSTYRIYFKKSGKKRIARMVDSPHHPEEEVIFALGEAGVIDPEDAEKKTKKTTKKVTTKKAKEPEVETTAETPEVETTAETSEIEGKFANAKETDTIIVTPQYEPSVDPSPRGSTVDTESDDSEPTEE